MLYILGLLVTLLIGMSLGGFVHKFMLDDIREERKLDEKS